MRSGLPDLVREPPCLLKQSSEPYRVDRTAYRVDVSWDFGSFWLSYLVVRDTGAAMGDRWEPSFRTGDTTRQNTPPNSIALAELDVQFDVVCGEFDVCHVEFKLDLIFVHAKFEVRMIALSRIRISHVDVRTISFSLDFLIWNKRAMNCH